MPKKAKPPERKAKSEEEAVKTKKGRGTKLPEVEPPPSVGKSVRRAAKLLPAVPVDSSTFVRLFVLFL